jgi:hypothetical protein
MPKTNQTWPYRGYHIVTNARHSILYVLELPELGSFMHREAAKKAIDEYLNRKGK